MFKQIFAAIFFSLFFTHAALAQTIAWNSEQGLERLKKSQFKNDFYQLANFYQPQENPLFCGIATATIILNAFDHGHIQSQKSGEIQKPDGNDVISYPLYTQESFFNAKTEKVKKRAIIEYREKNHRNGKDFYDPGVSLRDYSKLLEKGHNLDTKVIYAKKSDEKSIAKFRQYLKKTLKDDTTFIIANFDGQIIGRKTRGHISPLAAYDQESDSLLVLDVALHKNKWYWVSVNDLYRAMNSKDGDAYRGYLIAWR